MERQDIPALLKRYEEGNCTAEERAWLESWYLRHKPEAIRDLTPEELKEDLQRISVGLPLYNTGKQRRLWPRIAAAASIVLVLSSGIYFILHKSWPEPQLAVQKNSQDFTPGGNKAILTLANGRQIVLNDAQNGKLASQGNTAINKTADGLITYDNSITSERSVNNTLTYNTMTTPRGGQYHLVLADGTNVWLNAASSIRYPAAFTSNTREVELSGEAYFEVAHNPLKPFRVVSNGHTVEVLGTHFNINAYADEGRIKTDLLEGSVKISKKGQVAFLKPGQEAVTLTDQSKISVKKADVETSVEWKNGLFSFKRADLKTVMRQISRWYDVEVVYQGEVPTASITGTVGRNANASQVLQILRSLDIPFKIEGRKIIIVHN